MKFTIRASEGRDEISKSTASLLWKGILLSLFCRNDYSLFRRHRCLDEEEG